MTPNNSAPMNSQAVLSPPQPKPEKGPAAALPADPPQHRDAFREIVETIVFVTVLVLLLKSFVAEAFVIPTGSMAETLLGYRRIVTCPDCGEEFPVNCSEEVSPQAGEPSPVDGCTCPNCALHQVWRKNGQYVEKPPGWGSGDRVLVAKWPLQEFARWLVVVFKFPQEPQKRYDPMNYIKRCVGLPGETIAINNGDLFVNATPIDYSDQDQPDREADRWKKPFTYPNAQQAQEAFRAGKFNILRKPPPQILAMRRLVFDNDRQPESIAGVVPPRWAGGDWKANDPKRPTEFSLADGTDLSWLRYRHLVVPRTKGETPRGPFEPGLIKNVMGYNSADTSRMMKSDEDRFWVGDLMLEAEVEVTGGAGEVVFELSKGQDRVQARFNVATGECRLVRRGPVREEEIARQPTRLRGAGKYTIAFANVDERLTVWVNDALPFGDGVECEGDRSGQPDEVNDKQPASVGATGSVNVRHLKLWRDTYYTAPGSDRHSKASAEADLTLYVQPGHYLCLGDNSTQSSDGRDWGLVPYRLMLGRAVMVYFPVWPGAHRFGPIR